MAGKKKKKGVLERFWDTMESMRFAVVLLVVLAVVSLVGVLLPQFPPDGFEGPLETLFLQKYGPFFGGLFVFLGLDHLFTAWWYYLLLALLCLNVTVCSLNRLKRITALVRREHYLETEQDYRDQANNRSLRLDIAAEGAAGGVGSLLEQQGYRVFKRPHPSGEALLLYARKGALSHFGPFLSHISMVIIILGAAVSYLLSFQHFQWMGADEQIVVPDLGYMSSPGYQLELVAGRIREAFGSPGRPSGLMLADSVVRNSDWRRLPADLDLRRSFRVRLDRFEAQFTPQGKPKAYLSTVTVLGPGPEDGPLFSQLIKVNDPLIYQGMYFYQSSYAPSGRAAKWVELTVADKDSTHPERYELKLGIGRPAVPLGSSGDSIRLVRFTGNFRRNPQGEVLDLPGEDRNPAVQSVITRGGEVIMQGWSFKNFPDFSHRRDDPYAVVMGDYEKGYLSGLTIRTHHSQGVIWAGFALLVLGVMLSFYVNHRQLWAMVVPEGGARSRVHLAGLSYKWKQPFLAEFKSYLEKIRALSAGPPEAGGRPSEQTKTSEV
ncbi:MAG: cytochrome c biogenesis protein ResB [Candidatus Glassbacteria bacterium]|nr:cytochrome c biogenesis protein ResB [Candidatus Glassbacteria bacterium]